jgi:PAS domain S-box-containing protein
MKAAHSAVDAGVRRLFSWPGAAALAGALVLLEGFVWLIARHGLSTLELSFALALVAMTSAATWSGSRERARVASATAAELVRRQAMFRMELEQRLDTQRHLRESDARLLAIIDNAPIVLFAIDRDAVITFCAGVGPDPLGKKPGEARGWPAAELFVDYPDVVEGIRRALSGIEARAELTQNGRSFSFSLAPFRDPSGKTMGAIVVAADITEQRRIEGALRRTVTTLRQVDENRRALLRRLVHAQEEERRAIAGDIHDDSIQSMFAVGLRLSALRGMVQDAAQVELVDRLRENVQQSTDRLRHLLFELRPAALDEGGLPAALRESLEVFRRESGIEVELETAVAQRLAPETHVIAFRIAQEALANVRKHSQAHRVECTVSTVDDGILMRIVDDGVGFVGGRGVTPPGHLGLIAMRERAEMAGGWFRITSTTGKGCGVEYWIPDDREELARAA